MFFENSIFSEKFFCEFEFVGKIFFLENYFMTRFRREWHDIDSQVSWAT